MQTVLIVIHLMIVLALVGVVLIQRSEGGGLGIGGGSGFMSARGTANALTRTTAILATLFFITSLALGILARYESRPSDILNRIPQSQQGTGGGILDQLGPAPAPAPAGNGVPSGSGASAPAQATPATGATPAPAAPATGSAPAAPAAPTGVPTGQ
ncbi:preprotein translocase subunit SecG [Neorhizobium galegae]|uniref:preprotein translocase subunit SecG n=1 Tax=Neorhizobium galegae TaxID=399 RepID=UPI0006218B31|nr:preprotein translocase subunit SecG [Neorhizobium galegae]CDZ27277.1 Protein translocase, SecG subunit [Neorhizobium galegae bv. officinalis]KAA9387367.1 preprotein translocase subunit SecG [Neorhizobium galegae]KAB1114512.1 preprotein translocase subunit SecG [Neorhizobium galegae]MCM2496925.1 preprotein translocase subunit SecG [Neorhizobium galegae]MCQ1771727.1 preprotein translocase subunit SecG [Neorhizobium galegae]